MRFMRVAIIYVIFTIMSSLVTIYCFDDSMNKKIQTEAELVEQQQNDISQQITRERLYSALTQEFISLLIAYKRGNSGTIVIEKDSFDKIVKYYSKPYEIWINGK